MRYVLGILVLVLVAAPFAEAKKADLTPKALAKLAKEDPKKAAAGFGKTLAAARKYLELEEQMKIGKHVFSIVPKRGDRYRPADAIGLHKITSDAKTYSFFSGHHLAYTALFMATDSGDYTDLAPACALAAKLKKGAYAKTMASYSKALRAIGADKHAEALAPLKQVLDVCIEQQWGRLAFHVGLELALAHATLGDKESAKIAMEATLKAVPDDVTHAVRRHASGMAKRRLEGVDPTLFEAWSAEVSRGGSAGGAGGAGSRQGMTPLGKALQKGKRRQALVRVKRSGRDFQISYSFGNLKPKVHKRSGKGVVHVNEGGLLLAFLGNGVRLEFVNISSGKGAPGASSHAGTWQVFDVLADGETWSLLPTGEVQIK